MNAHEESTAIKIRAYSAAKKMHMFELLIGRWEEDVEGNLGIENDVLRIDPPVRPLGMARNERVVARRDWTYMIQSNLSFSGLLSS